MKRLGFDFYMAILYLFGVEKWFFWSLACCAIPDAPRMTPEEHLRLQLLPCI